VAPLDQGCEESDGRSSLTQARERRIAAPEIRPGQFCPAGSLWKRLRGPPIRKSTDPSCPPFDGDTTGPAANRPYSVAPYLQVARPNLSGQPSWAITISVAACVSHDTVDACPGY
jgi:hypothetical protein